MPKYICLFSLTGEAINRFLENHQDRKEPVSRLAESAGGKLEAYYWMFGQYDGFVIVEAPSSDAVAALALAVTSTGAFRQFETHELIPSENLVPLAQKARTLRPGYQAPWAKS